MNIVQIIQAAKLIISLLPLIKSAVDAVESMLPEKGKGAEKLEMVKTILVKSQVAADEATNIFEKAWTTIQGIIALYVKAKK